MFKLACISLLVAGCGAGGAGQDRYTSVRVLGGNDAQEVHPVPIDPKLPSVDRIASRVRYELGPSATTDLRLCVRPSGKVASVLLVGGSAYPPFDLAVVDDVRDWKFTVLPGPESLERCEKTEITYRTDL